jgi:hypothetical protein
MLVKDHPDAVRIDGRGRSACIHGTGVLDPVAGGRQINSANFRQL